MTRVRKSYVSVPLSRAKQMTKLVVNFDNVTDRTVKELLCQICQHTRAYFQAAASTCCSGPMSVTGNGSAWMNPLSVIITSSDTATTPTTGGQSPSKYLCRVVDSTGVLKKFLERESYEIRYKKSYSN